MKLAISNIAWIPGERGEAYDAMAEAGITGLEIAPKLFFNSSEDPFAPSANVARAALAEINDRGIQIVSMQSLLFGVGGAALFGDTEGRASFLRGMERAINLASYIGIPNLVFGSPAQRRVPSDLSMEEALDQAAFVFLRLAEMAQNAGTKIAIEANPAAYGTNFINTLDDALGFVRRVHHPAVACVLDLGAMHINGEYATTADRIPALLPTLSHVHVSEPSLAPAPRKIKALTPVVDALRAAGYGKSISIEMKPPSNGVVGVREALRRLSTAARKHEAEHG